MAEDSFDDLDWLQGAGDVDALSATVSFSGVPDEEGAAAPSSLMERYEVLDTLGEGGMGVVYLVRERNLRRPVALKCTRNTTEEAAHRFVLEAQVTAQLDHPGILPVYALELSKDGALAYSMKRVEGRTLEGAVARLRTLHAEAGDGARLWSERLSVLESLMRACEAVQFAHSRGVVHRDLKPANIMLGDHHEVYVLDWGLAKLRGRADVPKTSSEEPLDLPDLPLNERTLSTDIKGTPLYMAPEQAQGGSEGVGPHSDVYALGLILYEVLYFEFGRRATSFPEALEKAQSGELGTPPDGITVSAELEAILRRATALDPSQRYASAGDLAADLRAVIRGQETSVLPDRGWRRLRRWISRHPHLATIAAVSVVALLIGGWVATSIRQRAEAAEAALDTQLREDAISSLSARTAGHARTLALRLLAHSGHAKAIAAGTEELLAHGEQSEVKVFGPGAYAQLEGAPAGSEVSDHYGGRVICPQALVGFTTRGGDAGDQQLLGHLLRRLRAPFAHPGQDPEAVDDGIVAHQVPLEWTYVALQRSGTIVLFPGSQGAWDSSYDPRERTWYREAVEAYEEHGELDTWSKPYEDQMGQGLVVTCGHVVLGSDGVQGVAAVDISLLRLMHQLDGLSTQLPGYVRAVLLDSEGRILVSTGNATVRSQGPQAEVTFKKHPDAARLVDASRTDGWFRSGSRLFGTRLVAWARLPQLSWTLVVEADEGRLIDSFRSDAVSKDR